MRIKVSDPRPAFSLAVGAHNTSRTTRVSFLPRPSRIPVVVSCTVRLHVAWEVVVPWLMKPEAETNTSRYQTPAPRFLALVS